MNKKYAMYVGRWQNFHKGHEWLINQQLEKGKDVWVAIRDVPTDDKNPKTAKQVMDDFMDTDYYKKNSSKIMVSIIPDIESINYGRDVGYKVIEHIPTKEISDISGTKIREQLKEKGLL
jgi:nicotinamide mononucleotide adenylyltransferase